MSIETAIPEATVLPVVTESAVGHCDDPAPHAHSHHHAHGTGTGCCSTTPTPDGLAPAAGVTTALPLAPSADGACCETTSSTGCSNDIASAESVVESEDSGIDDGALIDALREVIDPELMINIVDLGLVYSINHTDRKVAVDMTLTSPACPAGPQIIMQSKMALEKVAGVDVAEIKLVMSPPWTPARMTDEARDQLGIF